MEIQQGYSYCLHCGDAFECKAGDINHCVCNSIQLTKEERAYIRLFYQDCICVQCLKLHQQEYRNKMGNTGYS